jgi:hypothetical protein
MSRIAAGVRVRVFLLLDGMTTSLLRLSSQDTAHPGDGVGPKVLRFEGAQDAERVCAVVGLGSSTARPA